MFGLKGKDRKIFTYFSNRNNFKEHQYLETSHCRNIHLTNTFTIKIEKFYMRKYFC